MTPHNKEHGWGSHQAGGSGSVVHPQPAPTEGNSAVAWVRGAQGTGRQAGWPLLRKRSGKYLAQVSLVREALCWTTAPILIPTQTRGLTEAHHLQSPSANAGSLALITKLGTGSSLDSNSGTFTSISRENSGVGLKSKHGILHPFFTQPEEQLQQALWHIRSPTVSHPTGLGGDEPLVDHVIVQKLGSGVWRIWNVQPVLETWLPDTRAHW